MNQRWLLGLVVAGCLAPEIAEADSITDPIWAVLGYTTSSFLLTGALIAIEIAAIALLGGTLLGLLIATMRLSARRRRICSAVSNDCRTSMVSTPRRSRIARLA